MSSFPIYLAEASICLALFYTVYILLKGDTFFSLRRVYLLLTLILSLLIPQISLPFFKEELKQIQPIEKTSEIKDFPYHDTFEKIVVGQFPDTIMQNDVKKRIPIKALPGILYLIGFLFFLNRFIRNIKEIYRLYRFNPKERFQSYDVTLLRGDYPSFSFFNHIFLNSDKLCDEDRDYIMLHELVHVRLSHSIDIILMEICKVIFWFNPVIWQYKKALVAVHECQADSFFTREMPDKINDYQSLLLKQYLSKISIELAHPFNYSFIKYRIKMMTKIKSNRIAKYKLAFAIPIVFLGLLAFSNVDTDQGKTDSKSSTNYEPGPMGMVFIPQGNFTLIRTDGTATNKFNVSLDAFWMKETEVTNEEYADYLESLKKDSASAVYKSALPDLSIAPMEGYFEKMEYKKYPVVGVSYKQAGDFCKWKTRKENLQRNFAGKSFIADYRLPDEVEWVYASLSGQSPDEIKKPLVPGLMEIKKGKEIKKDLNDFGLIYMFSNVSEWTNTAFEPEKYMNELQNTPLYPSQNIVVRGENYKQALVNDKLILKGDKSFAYVGFRYVRTYMGNE